MTKVIGIDEAGRGPVIGPLIIAGIMIDEGHEEMLGKVKDSKMIKHKKRVILAKHLRENFKHKIISISPEEIDSALNSDHLNLNWLEAHKQAEIINSLKPDVVIIDSPSANPKKYKEYLLKLLENKKIKLVVEHKADVNYPICSAASIIAKVKREEEMDSIKEKYGNTGPGYPVDKRTIDFLKKNWDKYPEIFRKTWSTYKRYARSKGQKSLFVF